jgi:non-homologous end joining protein Ku
MGAGAIAARLARRRWTTSVKTKKGKFDPSKFEDRYENALKDLLKKKQKGEKIERPKETKPSNVVDLAYIGQCPDQ